MTYLIFLFFLQLIQYIHEQSNAYLVSLMRVTAGFCCSFVSVLQIQEQDGVLALGPSPPGRTTTPVPRPRPPAHLAFTFLQGSPLKQGLGAIPSLTNLYFEVKSQGIIVFIMVLQIIHWKENRSQFKAQLCTSRHAKGHSNAEACGQGIWLALICVRECISNKCQRVCVHQALALCLRHILQFSLCRARHIRKHSSHSMFYHSSKDQSWTVTSVQYYLSEQEVSRYGYVFQTQNYTITLLRWQTGKRSLKSFKITGKRFLARRSCVLSLLQKQELHA